ncbi:hypothetical protein Lalb_Chr20g0115401 [Lupinus albus]|uniref:Uncharacterized protein n=1 Tax=Lupinus albus TaxID=3870 RepID=A0A6A4NXB9_LUPAL|nr:hypothetical protein Lalb_Chr20g0115401 [Lupinus albus]
MLPRPPLLVDKLHPRVQQLRTATSPTICSNLPSDHHLPFLYEIQQYNCFLLYSNLEVVWMKCWAVGYSLRCEYAAG